MATTKLAEPHVTKALTFNVPGNYSAGMAYGDFDSAVEAAVATIQTFDYGGLGTRDSRAFVDLRETTETQAGPIIRWEVFKDGSAVRCLEDQGGLTDEQRDALIASGKVTANERAGR